MLLRLAENAIPQMLAATVCFSATGVGACNHQLELVSAKLWVARDSSALATAPCAASRCRKSGAVPLPHPGGYPRKASGFAVSRGNLWVQVPMLPSFKTKARNVWRDSVLD